MVVVIVVFYYVLVSVYCSTNAVDTHFTAANAAIHGNLRFLEIQMGEAPKFTNHPREYLIRFDVTGNIDTYG